MACGLLAVMRSMLPWRNLLAATSNMKLELSDGQREYVTGGERDYSTLPAPLVMEDGTAVADTKQFETRRAEILRLFEENVGVRHTAGTSAIPSQEAMR